MCVLIRAQMEEFTHDSCPYLKPSSNISDVSALRGLTPGSDPGPSS